MEVFFITCILIIIAFLLFDNLFFNTDQSSSIPYAQHGHYPIVGHLFAFLHDRTKFLIECYQRHGTCFRVRLLHHRFIMVLSPSDWTSIMRNQAFYFPTADHIEHLFDASSASTSDPAFVLETRRQYTQYLKNRDGLRPLIVEFLGRLCDQMKNERTLLAKNGTLTEWQSTSLLELSYRMIYQASTETLFGEIDATALEKDFRLFDDNFHHFGMGLPRWINSCFLSKELQARSRLNHSWSKNQHPKGESEFLQARKALFLANDHFISERDFRGNQTGLLWASLANTIPAVFWCLFYLLQDTNAIEIIRQEIDTNLPVFSLHDDEDSGASARAWTPEQLNACVYLESAINETLRMAASPMIVRKCKQPTELVLHDGRRLIVQPNETIAWLAAVTHRDPKLFPEPERFVFDRFFQKNADAIPGFTPFGGGKSICPGRFFARNEMKICVAILLRFFDYKLVESKIVPRQKVHRVGFGVAPPDDDISIIYRYKV